MRYHFLIPLLVLLMATLAACGGASRSTADNVAADAGQAVQEVQSDVASVAEEPERAPKDVQSSSTGVDPGPEPVAAETLVDEQGAVSVSIRPLNVGQPGPTLNFEVALNTHSVDLSMDLSQLAVLTTDTGLEITPAGWEAPSGGHHVTGLLSFPAQLDGVSLLDQASSIQLVLKDVDAPVRTFTWALK